MDSTDQSTETPPKPKFRIEAIDLARGAALVAMAIYHFTWDLEFFGYADPGLTAEGGWRLFARCIASSFLMLAGVSLFLAHADGIRWASFGKRFAMVAGAALAISVATYFAVPGGFIFFGILHQIALASLLGLAFLLLPVWVIFPISAFFIAAPHFLRSPAFDGAEWWWLGLSASIPRSNDYVPVFPWFGAVLIGIAAAKLASRFGNPGRLAAWIPGAWSKPLQIAGRHSLAVYLIHQPVLIACIWAVSQIAPPAAEPAEVGFTRSCAAQCGETRDAAFCVSYCACVLDRLEAEGLAEAVFAGTTAGAAEERVQEIVFLCSTDPRQRGEGQ